MKALLFVTVLMAMVSYSPSSSPRPEDLLRNLKKDAGPGGAIAVIRDGQLVFSESFGWAVEGTPITDETNFRLASVTKQFTATAVMILAERGEMGLEQPLSKFFADLAPAIQGITVRQLLTHTSGIVAYEDLIPDTATVPVLDRDVLQLVAPVDSTYFVPGTAYRYSNTGYAILALIVEQVSGRSFAEFLKREIFAPLGMSLTVAFENDISTVRNRAYGFSPDPDHPGTFLDTDQSMTSSVLGDGGIYSSIRDLQRWDQGLRQGSIISAAGLQNMLSPQTIIDEDERWYGLGWYLALAGTDTISYHGGSTVGFRTCIIRIPSRSSAVIALFNRSDAHAEEIAWKLAEHFGLITPTE